MRNQNPGLSQAINANRVGMGMSANPTLPPGLSPTGGMPRSPGANLNGATENTGNPSAAISALIRAMSNSGGSGPAAKISSRGSRGPEKPSIARSGAISRRLNGGASRGTELKGL
jgi:hypothetical protein